MRPPRPVWHHRFRWSLHARPDERTTGAGFVNGATGLCTSEGLTSPALPGTERRAVAPPAEQAARRPPGPLDGACAVARCGLLHWRPVRPCMGRVSENQCQVAPNGRRARHPHRAPSTGAASFDALSRDHRFGWSSRQRHEVVAVRDGCEAVPGHLPVDIRARRTATGHQESESSAAMGRRSTLRRTRPIVVSHRVTAGDYPSPRGCGLLEMDDRSGWGALITGPILLSSVGSLALRFRRPTFRCPGIGGRNCPCLVSSQLFGRRAGIRPVRRARWAPLSSSGRPRHGCAWGVGRRRVVEVFPIAA